MTQPPRREFLKLAFAGALAAVGRRSTRATASAEPLGPARPSPPTACSTRRANWPRKPSRRPSDAPRAPSATSISTNTPSIRRDPGTAVWGDGKSGFALEPLHRGFIFTTPMELNVVENGQSQRLIYDRSLYDFGKLDVPKDLPDLGFSGVRLLQRRRRRRLEGRGDFPGRHILQEPGARADLRRERARPFDPHRRRAGRGISAVSRAVDRKARPGLRHAGHPRAARFGEPDRRLPLHAARRRRDHHRHRTHA